MIRAIIFDFGGVILQHRIDIIPFILHQLFPGDNDEILTIWDANKILLNTGELSSKDFLMQIKNAIKSNTSIEELLIMWKNIYQEEAKDINWELLAMIDHLKKTYKVYLFTDTIDVHDTINSRRGIYEKFDTVYKSFEEGISKQAGKEAFFHVLQKMHATPEECLFIDDLQSNVDTATDVGMEALLYTSNEQLEKDFTLLAISTQSDERR